MDGYSRKNSLSPHDISVQLMINDGMIIGIIKDLR